MRGVMVAISGEKASFLAGGEFPYPVPEDLNKIAIEFRPYGVKLDFLPTVQDNGWIRLAVPPEVSQLDANNAVTVNGLTVPALTTRRANTTLELFGFHMSAAATQQFNPLVVVTFAPVMSWLWLTLAKMLVLPVSVAVKVTVYGLLSSPVPDQLQVPLWLPV